MNRLLTNLSATVALSGVFLSGCGRKGETLTPVPETVFRGMYHHSFELNQKRITTNKSESLKKIDSLLTDSEKLILQSYSETFEVRSRLIIEGIEKDIEAGVSQEEIAGGLKRLILELKLFEEDLATRIKNDPIGPWILERRTNGTWFNLGYEQFVPILDRIRDKTYNFTSIPEEEKKKITDAILYHYKKIKLYVESLENSEELDPPNLHVVDGYAEILEYLDNMEMAFDSNEKLFPLAKKLLENSTDPIYKKTVLLSFRFALDLHEDHDQFREEKDIFTLIEKLSESSSRKLNVMLASFRVNIDSDRFMGKQWKFHEHILPPILEAIRVNKSKELADLTLRYKRDYIPMPPWPDRVEVIPITGLEYLDWGSVMEDVMNPQKGSIFSDLRNMVEERVVIVVGKDVRPGEHENPHQLLNISDMIANNLHSTNRVMTLYSPGEDEIDAAINGMISSRRLNIFLIGLGFTGKRVADEDHDGFVIMKDRRAIAEDEIRWRSDFWSKDYKNVRIFVISDGAGAWAD